MKISSATYNIEVNDYELRLIAKSLGISLSDYINRPKEYDKDYNSMVNLRNQISDFLKEELK